MLYLPNAQFVYSKDKFFPEAFNATSHSISSFLTDKKTRSNVWTNKALFLFLEKQHFYKNNKPIFTPSKPLYILFTILRLQSMNIHRTAFGLVSLKNGHKYSTNILAIGGILIAGGGSAQDVNNIIFFSSFPLKLKTKWINKTITKMQHQQKRRTKKLVDFPFFSIKKRNNFFFSSSSSFNINPNI